MKLADEIGAVVYSLYDEDDQLVYVGQTTHLKVRLVAHRHHRRRFSRVEIVGPFEVSLARRVETRLIWDLAPRENRLHNPRRGYPWGPNTYVRRFDEFATDDDGPEMRRVVAPRRRAA